MKTASQVTFDIYSNTLPALVPQYSHEMFEPAASRLELLHRFVEATTDLCRA